MQLEGRNIVVTGGASGIGRATVLTLAREGARVLIADMNEEGAKETIALASGGSVEFVHINLADGASIAAAAATILERTGSKVDGLVSAAGWDKLQPFVDATPEFIDQIMAINLTGPVKLTHALFPAMIAANRGKIVFVSSDAGRVGSMGETPYSGAKGGQIGFAKSLAREGARYGINVNVVAPGPTDTPLFATNPQRMQEALVKAIPFRRLAQPEDIANAILYFVGPTSDYVTGQVLSVSGGLTMHG